MARKITEAAYVRSNQTNVKTPFSVKKMQFISEEAKKILASNNQAQVDKFIANLKQLNS